MGEKPAGRMLVLVGLLLASLFIGMASAESGELTLEVSEDTPPETAWYSPQHPLILTPTLVNNGPDASLTVNPVCPFVYNVYNATNTVVVSGLDACPVREQGMDVFAGERVAFDPVEWSMKDDAGQWLESGAYTVELLHSSGLSSVREVLIQTPVSIPEALTYSVSTTQRANAEGPVVYMVSLHNPTASSIDVSSQPACLLEAQLGSKSHLGSNCFADVKVLMPGEVILVDQFVALQSDAVALSTPGNDFTYATSPTVSEVQPTSPVEMAMQISGNQLPKFGPEDQLLSEVLLSSADGTSTVVEFTSSCKAEMWIVDDLGNTVFDSRAGKTCTEIDLELALTGEPERLTLPQWNFFLNDGCRAEPGTYTVITEVPEHGLVASQHIEYQSVEADPCAEASTAALEATILWPEDALMNIAATMSSDTDQYLRMAQPCTFEVAFLNSDDELVHVFQTLCDAYDGRKILLPSTQERLQFDTLDVSMVQQGEALLPDGQYTLQLTVLSTAPATATLPFSWPQDFNEVVEEEPEESSVSQRFELLGTWAEISTEQGTCYVMDDGEATHLLSNAKTLPAWSPNAQTQGLYVVVFADPSPACAGFIAPSVEVVEVRMEEALAAEEEPVVAAPIAEETPLVQSSPAVAVVSVVVTASILSILVVAATTNEALRLPATVAGLWFLGLLGKTHETTDGRYQRGRLMGYLTANPGCHFRALMSALEMSNGQITHHLRILEAEEHVWRKNDGRLVRFYPLTNQLNPSTKEADLPVPPLSPDPNSLQGKILNLLDEDGGMGQFPTQAELAKRLEKSQQLISHHLRTLQKFGLVERRKMGVKNRYKLTREAIFLLETSADFAHDDAR